MRTFLLVVLILCGHIAFSQLTDNFSDGNYTSNPIWSPSATTDFTVVSGQLKSANTTTNTNFYISTTNTLATNCQWEFYVNLQFNTSSTNYVDVYLVSNVANLQSTTINGYFVRIGGTLDEVCLYKRSGATTTSAKLIDGVDGITNVSNNTLKIKVVRNSSNNWSLERDVTGTGNNYISEGTITDATYTTTSAFGFFIQQSTLSFTQKHVFDDIVVGPIVLDVTPPTLVSSSIVSPTAIDVLFNENVSISTSQSITNYTLNPAMGTPLSATRDASDFKLVHLIFASPLVSGTNYTLAVNQVQDMAGNPISTSTLNFTYQLFGTPNYKDIIINEIYADPSPLVNLTSCEFVELYNKSSNPFNLNGLKLTDGSALATLTNYTLFPNAYVIICPITDTAQFTALGYANKLGVSSFPSLNNTNDNLYLKTALNNYIDSVNYNDTWYRDAIKQDGGYSLELINPFQNNNCSQANNWKASNDADGGTPGFINSVYDITPDVVGPTIANVLVLDSLHLAVCLDDVISISQLQTTSNYVINNAIGSPTLALANNGNSCVNLFLGAPLTNATNYTLTVSNLTDCNANAVSTNTILFSLYKPKYQDIVINELMPDPDPAINLPTEEFVELKNRTAFNINLTHWKFSTSTSSKLLPNITIKPDSFVVLTGIGNASAFYNNGIVAYEVSNFPALSNYGTTLTLRDSNNVLINSISYTTNWYHDDFKKAGGWSLEQIDANNPCGGANNWHASNNSNGGTPGKRNSVIAINTDNLAPQIERVEVIDKDTIVLLFTEPMDSLSLTSSSAYQFDNGLTAPLFISPLGTDFRKVKLKLSSSLSVGTLYHISFINNLTDCVGNLINTLVSAPFALPQAPTANDVVINEVLFEPNTGGVDFIELYNRSNKTLDLKQLRIGSMDTLTNTLKNTEPITEEGYLFFPETYLVLSENGAIVKQQYQTNNPQGFLDIANLPTMSNDAGVVTVSDTSRVVIDDFKYTSKMHFPLLASTKGVSLERIDFNRTTNDYTNWNSAAENVGFATPAYRNSQYLLADGGTGVTIANPLFSPDNDGYQDVLNISYQLNETGMVANVFVYDSKGRQIRHLIKNEAITQNGVWSWNGINDAFEKAPIGIYVVYIELFNLSGKINKYKLSCTLAGKL